MHFKSQYDVGGTFSVTWKGSRDNFMPSTALVVLFASIPSSRHTVQPLHNHPVL